MAVVALLTTFTGIQRVGAEEGARHPAWVEGEIIVKMREGASPSSILSKVPGPRMRVIRRHAGGRIARIATDGRTPEEAARELMRKSSDSVEYAEPNYLVYLNRVPDDPRFDELYALQNRGQNGGTAGADIGAVSAWDMITGGNAVVAIVDSGVDFSHPDLAKNIWNNDGEISGNGIDDDGNGLVDDCRGWDFLDGDGEPWDGYSHGTHCAGIIAAVGNNGMGVAGVNWAARIMPLRFIGSEGWGTMADAVEAIDYAVKMGADVINCSWGGPAFSRSLEDAIEAARAAGVIVVAAAGNAGTSNDNSPLYPASYDSDNIIAVAATDSNDSLAAFSCWGPHSVDIGAPGVDILSTLPGGGYGGMTGTSMAAPFVAGAASLARARDPGLSYTEVIAAILSSADPSPYLDGKVASGGRLNLPRMLNPSYIPPAALSDLEIFPGTLKAGETFTCGIALNKDITEAFDYYLIADTSRGPYILSFNGSAEPGITALYRDVPGFEAPYETTVSPMAAIPASKAGEQVTFFTVVVEAGTIPPVFSLSALTPTTPCVIMMDRKTVTVEP